MAERWTIIEERILGLDLTHAELAFYVRLSMYRINQRGHAQRGRGFPTRDELCASAKLSKRRVNELLAALRDKGAIASFGDSDRLEIVFSRAETSPTANTVRAGEPPGRAEIPPATPTSISLEKQKAPKQRKRKVEDVPGSPYAIGQRSPANWPPARGCDMGDLLAFEVGGARLLRTWLDRYPSLDGRNGRPTIMSVCEAACERLAERPPRDKALTPKRFEAWLQPAAERCHAAWLRDTGGKADAEAMAEAGRRMRILS